MRWKVITSSTHCNENKLKWSRRHLVCITSIFRLPAQIYFLAHQGHTQIDFRKSGQQKTTWNAIFANHIRTAFGGCLKSDHISTEVPQSVWMLLLLKLDFKMSFVSRNTRHHPIQTDWISATVCGQSLWNKPTFFMLPCWKATWPVYVVTDACYHSNPCRSVGDVWTQKSNLKSLNNSMDTPIWFPCSVNKP